jgi:hypothetical protein
MARAALRRLARNMRHPARTHPGARQARRGVGAARTSTATRRPPAQRPRLGDPPPSGTRRLRRRRRRPRPPLTPCRRRAHRRPNPPCAPRTGPPSRPRHPRRPRRGERTRRPGADQPDATGDPVDDTTRRGLRPRHLQLRARGRLLRGSDPRCARPLRATGPISRALQPGQRVVGHLRPRGQPVLRRDRRPAVERLHHAQLGHCPTDRSWLVAR